MSVLHCDFETASTLNLKKVGAYVYAMHPSTQVLSLSWAFDKEPVQTWRPGQVFPVRMLKHVHADGEVHGWNVMFEYLIWNIVLPRHITLPPLLDISQLHCTMARAACWGLPMQLDKAGAAVGASIQKDAVGHRLMLQMSKPRSFDPVTGDPIWWHETDAVKYDRLCQYNATDVEAEREIEDLLPNMPPWEREVWLMDARMNMRGFRIDKAAVAALHHVVDNEVRRLNIQMRALTGGSVSSTSDVGALARYAESFGYPNNGMAAPVLDALLADTSLPIRLRMVLALRKKASKTSTRKLVSMQDCCPHDSRVRGLFQYAGAPRTLRWAGRLIQPQNLPRPLTGLDTGAVIQAVLAGADSGTIELIFGDTLDVVASCLRACFQASPGNVLAVCDYSAIEARALAWLAGQTDILDVFARGEDVYMYMAQAIGSTDRQMGKVTVLGCGYQMGWLRFKEHAASYGITVTDAEAVETVQAWRDANPSIVSFWYALDAAAKDAIKNPGTEYKIGGTRLRMGRNRMVGALLIELPNGSLLSYRGAHIEYDPQGRESICFWGVDQKTRNWSKQRTYGGKLCLAGETQVLTECGWMRLDAITDERVWDGHEWASHDGLSDNGVRETITVDGVSMTPDHLVLTEKGWLDASSCEGLDRAPVALPDGTALRGFGWKEVALDRPLRLRCGEDHAGDGIDQGPTEILRLSEGAGTRRAATHSRHVEAPGLRRLALDAGSLPVADAPGLAQLRREGHHGVPGMAGLHDVLGGHGADIPVGPDTGSDRQQRRVLSRELPLDDPERAVAEHPPQPTHRDAVGPDDGVGSVGAQRDRRHDTALPTGQRGTRVYDLVNAGLRKQFVVAGRDGPLIVHNCENITQSMARHLLADAMLRCEDQGVLLVGTVHDEIVAEAPAHIGDHVFNIMRQVMRTAPIWAKGLPLNGTGSVAVRYGKG